MDKIRVIKLYLEHLEKGEQNELMSLFTSDAVVDSPLSGKVLAKNFYQKLFEDTISSKIILKNIFNSIENPKCAAAHFIYEWVKKDKNSVKFECVDIFEFSTGTNKIQHLMIIWDTYSFRRDQL